MSAVIGYLIIGALSFVSRLPEALLVGIARVWGRIGPRFMRSRAALARKNLARVYAYRDGVAPMMRYPRSALMMCSRLRGGLSPWTCVLRSLQAHLV